MSKMKEFRLSVVFDSDGIIRLIVSTSIIYPKTQTSQRVEMENKNIYLEQF
ncbi:hypothetical protein Pcaca05_18320 [Pectobacterium carotovorum subsp. carotovorum]|nr:hypothetical protein Pcaca05_18320 [Pectobacterium carotovorum subsp. carotovorum]